jgi:hypothetical protein
MSSQDRSFPLLSLVFNVFAIPYNFVVGFAVGALAPLGAIAAIVAGIRLLTGKFPFPSFVQEEGTEDRRVTLELMEPDRASELFAEQKEHLSGEFAKFQSEIKAIIEEAQASGKLGDAEIAEAVDGALDEATE